MEDASGDPEVEMRRFLTLFLSHVDEKNKNSNDREVMRRIMRTFSRIQRVRYNHSVENLRAIFLPDDIDGFVHALRLKRIQIAAEGLYWRCECGYIPIDLLAVSATTSRPECHDAPSASAVCPSNQASR
jgi:hypothetical protein